jgi:hypothetical protein
MSYSTRFLTLYAACRLPTYGNDLVWLLDMGATYPTTQTTQTVQATFQQTLPLLTINKLEQPLSLSRLTSWYTHVPQPHPQTHPEPHHPLPPKRPPA